MDNDTNKQRSLTLEIDHDSGTSTTNTWVLEPRSDKIIAEYPPFSESGTVTASVEGYETVSNRWNAAERMMYIVIEQAEITILLLIS